MCANSHSLWWRTSVDEMNTQVMKTNGCQQQSNFDNLASHHTQTSVGTTKCWREKVECDAGRALVSSVVEFYIGVIILHAARYSKSQNCQDRNPHGTNCTRMSMLIYTPPQCGSAFSCTHNSGLSYFEKLVQYTMRTRNCSVSRSSTKKGQISQPEEYKISDTSSCKN